MIFNLPAQNGDIESCFSSHEETLPFPYKFGCKPPSSVCVQSVWTVISIFNPHSLIYVSLSPTWGSAGDAESHTNGESILNCTSEVIISVRSIYIAQPNQVHFSNGQSLRVARIRCCRKRSWTGWLKCGSYPTRIRYLFIWVLLALADILFFGQFLKTKWKNIRGLKHSLTSL